MPNSLTESDLLRRIVVLSWCSYDDFEITLITGMRRGNITGGKLSFVGGNVKGKSVEYRGVIKEEWLDSLWEEVIPEHFPALRHKTVQRVRSAQGRDWDRIDFEFSDGTNLHLRTEPMVRIRAVLWKQTKEKKQRLRVYPPVLIRWEANRKRRPRQDPFFPENR